MVNSGSKLRELRQKQNIKQDTLAQVLGIAQRKISGIEGNSVLFNTKQIFRLVEFFKVSPSYFLQDDESPTASANGEYLKRIEAILIDFKQTSESLKQQLADKTTIINLLSLNVSTNEEIIKKLNTKINRIQIDLNKHNEQMAVQKNSSDISG